MSFYFRKKHFAAERDEIKLKLANTKSDENDEQKKFMANGNKNKKLFAIKTSFFSPGRQHAIVHIHEAICRYFFVSLGIALPSGAFYDILFRKSSLCSPLPPAPAPYTKHTLINPSMSKNQCPAICQSVFMFLFPARNSQMHCYTVSYCLRKL